METQQNVIELDVRPILLAKEDPFHKIMTAVKGLKGTDLFVLHATFKPSPLIAVMKRKGFKHEAKQVEKGHWMVHFWKESSNE